MEGYVHSIETLGALDGPGIRTVVFMQGCNLRCRYCHNPDTHGLFSLSKAAQDPSKESRPTEKEKEDKVNFDIYSVDELFSKIIRYREYYGGGGGVTASGGEPLLQAEFLTALFQKLKAAGINTALDTSGSVLNESVKGLLNYVDLVILDVKHTDSAAYENLCGTRGILSAVMAFLEYCAGRKKRVWLRQVIIPGINDTKEQVLELKKLADKYKPEKVELLPYHTMGVSKWEKLGLDYSLKDIPPADEKTVTCLYRSVFRA